MFQDRITQYWVRRTGRTITMATTPWLMGPMGKNQQWKVATTHLSALPANPEMATGLIPNFYDLETTSGELEQVHPLIKDFYEQTEHYSLKIQAQWNWLFKPIGWIIQSLFSKRLEQLHLPLQNKQLQMPLGSELTQVEDQQHLHQYTIWHRFLEHNKQTIFSGLYGHCQLPSGTKVVKVVFPLPTGNATIFLQPKAKVDGSFELHSKGKKFGQDGFYFTLSKQGKYYARFVSSMHEKLSMKAISDVQLQAAHNFYFYGIRFLTMHYNILRK